MFEWIKDSQLGDLFLSLNSNQLAQFHFLRPAWLWAIPVAALLAWAVSRHVSGQGRWQKLLDPQLLSALTLSAHTSSSAYRSSSHWLTTLLALGWILGSLAMAGPVWEKQPQPVYKAPQSRVVILDLSPSMQATDIAPNRLKRAKFKLRDLLKLDQQQDRDQRTGLIVFAGDAHIVVPLTDDKATIEAMLPALDIDIMPLAGNRLAPALKIAKQLLDGVKAQHGQILLLSDGVADTASSLKWINVLRQQGHKLDIISLGGDGSDPLTRADGSLIRDRNQQLLSPNVNRDNLTALANAAKGKHLRLRSDDNDLLALSERSDWQQRLDQPPVNSASRSAQSLQKQPLQKQQWQEQGPWLLIPLLLIAALFARKGWLLALILIIQLPGTPSAIAADTTAANSDISSANDSDTESIWRSRWNNLWQRPDQQAAKQLQAGNAAAAAQRFNNPRWKAAAQYQAKDYQAAQQTLQGYNDARAHYNRGNALAHNGKLKAALASYDAALKINPNDNDAQANRNLVESLLRKQQEQKQDKQQDQKQSDSDKQDPANKQSGKQKSAEQKSKNGKPNSDKSQSAPSSGDTNPSDDRPEPSKPNDKAQAPSTDQPPAPKPEDPQQQTSKSVDNSHEKNNENAPSTGKDSAQPTQKKADPTQHNSAKAKESLTPEQQQKQLRLDQWLRQIPDDPAELLRNKFMLEHLRRQRQQSRR